MTTFAGTPGMLVRLRRPVGRIKSFRFNDEGQFSTESPILIKRVSQRYEIVPTTIEEVKEEVKSEVIKPVTRKPKPKPRLRKKVVR